MSKDNKHTQGSPGDFEDKIDSAMLIFPHK